MKLLTLLCLVALLSGCVHTVVELPNNGGKFSRTSFLSSQTVGKVEVKLSGPDAGVKIGNYGQEGTTVAAQALQLAADALKKTP